MLNNKVALTGVISSDIEFDHDSHGTNFYKFYLRSNRLSDNADIIPIIFNENLINKDLIKDGNTVTVIGEYRSFNFHSENTKTKLVLNIFANEIIICDSDNQAKHTNVIELKGYLCKNPVFRTTPLNRKICDVLLAVNRNFNKSDYIPCILWGKNAEICKDLTIGSNIEIIGRIQSREYQKKINEENTEKKVAYEVSVAKLNVL